MLIPGIRLPNVRLVWTRRREWLFDRAAVAHGSSYHLHQCQHVNLEKPFEVVWLRHSYLYKLEAAAHWPRHTSSQGMYRETVGYFHSNPVRDMWLAPPSLTSHTHTHALVCHAETCWLREMTPVWLGNNGRAWWITFCFLSAPSLRDWCAPLSTWGWGEEGYGAWWCRS